MFDELAPDDLPLAFRVRHVLEASQKLIRPIQDAQIEMHLRGKRLLNLIAFTGPQHAVVHKHTGQLIADGFVRQHGGHGRIHAAAEGAEHAALADLLADLLHGGFDVGPHGPGGFTRADVVHEISQNLRPFDRMNHLGMELQAVDPALVVVPFHRRNRRIVGVRDRPESLRHTLDPIAVRHPNGSRPPLPDPFEQIRPIVDPQLRPAILPML